MTYLVFSELVFGIIALAGYGRGIEGVKELRGGVGRLEGSLGNSVRGAVGFDGFVGSDGGHDVQFKIIVSGAASLRENVFVSPRAGNAFITVGSPSDSLFDCPSLA